MSEITTFRDNTRTLLLNRPASLTIATIAKDINVSTAWLNMFARGKIDNPGVVTIETLHNYLKKAGK